MPIKYQNRPLMLRSHTLNKKIVRNLKKLGKRALLLGTLFGAAAFLMGVIVITAAFAWYGRDLPDPNTLMDRNVPQSTKIYDRTGETLLYEIHGAEKRTLIKLDDIPEYAIWATIAIEDKNFYQHRGISLQRIAKAIYTDVMKRSLAEGASTLTQQFVKNAILSQEKKFARKLKEIILALQIERLYTKKQILQMYFNEIPYGSTIYGIESAAQSYFGKSATNLSLDEAALLAALPQAPDYFSPYGSGSRGDNRDKLVKRQKLILDLMTEQGHITQAQADEAKSLDTLKKLQPKKVGDIRAPHFVMYVRSQLIEKYGQRAAEEDGLKVVTTLDWPLQQIAEEEVSRGVETRGQRYGFSNSALAALDPKNGQILSMVGSKDFFDQENDGQVNVTLRPRQPGSSFKPVVYAAGFAKGFTPEMILWDVNTVFKTDLRDYAPKNYDLGERGPVSVRKALQGSLNIPAVKMLYLTGVGRVLDFAEQLGYSTFGDRGRFGLALVLGGGEVKLLEHTHAYAVFANQGQMAPLASILKVEDADGKILEEWRPAEGRQAVEPEVARRLSDVLSDNEARAFIFGAHNYLTLPDRPAAAKTGTTNDYHDAWTLGYIPTLAAGVWVGNNDNSAMKRGADGSVVAAPIWQNFMQRAVAQLKLPAEQFPKPPPSNAVKPVLLGQTASVKVKIDKISGKLATEFTPPDLIEERVYQAAHNVLWYLDKDDPSGPAPQNPEKDPQFASWEAAVQDWVIRAGWASTTQAAPAEYDDIHTSDAVPQITILWPTPYTAWDSREASVSVSISAPRRITRMEARLDNQLIGASADGGWTFAVSIPNSVSVGYHDLTIAAMDEFGSRGSASITINLTAETQAARASIVAPAHGAYLSLAAFPAQITVTLTDPAASNRVDIFLQNVASGNTRLIASEFNPADARLQITWNTAPSSGAYDLYPVLTLREGTAVTGARVRVTID